MLPSPTLSFTLPSIHDDTRLDCRIYHPECLSNQIYAATSSRTDTEETANEAPPPPPPWRKHAAVVSHPYAPMGGCYDDPIVDVVAGTLLKVGFMVATFNFRGAATSDGRTSWTSKPERADYMSLVGFLAYYVHYLESPSPTATCITPTPPVLLLAGYSYGATITSRLPPLHDILSHFHSPVVHTAAADIRLRAQHLAEQQNAMSNTPLSPRKSLGIRVGGQEGPGPNSHHRPGSFSYVREEGIRKGVKDLLSRTKIIHRRHRRKPSDQSQEVEHVEHCMEKVEAFTAFRSAYLLVSPPFGILTNLATMTLPNPFTSWSRRASKARDPPVQDRHAATERREVSEDDDKFVSNPTLAIYGDRDGFLALKKMREWTARLSGLRGSLFRHIEVAGAGHFWMEGRVIVDLAEAVGSFGVGLRDSS
ncbi:hypothetical protein DL763_005210 [Monosporascus cannonballus]|nr:hypothetical protein DL763_005210 [Monosporascus cannonballus]